MTQGIHHITAIASDAQKTINFYTNILGLRLVKRTVNQDDVGTYHLFFGDRLGHPGMDLTFFIFRPTMQGKNGNGLVTKISLTVPEESLDFWSQRFEKFNIKHNKINESFGRKRIGFSDFDDLQLELVGLPEKEIEENADIWETKEITKENAIRSFYSATLSVSDLSFIDPVLKHVYNYEQIHKDGFTYLYKVASSTRANILEVVADKSVDTGVQGAGVVHHIAFRAKDENEQREFTQNALKIGLYPTQVIDRFYFKSVYFRTPAGILFETATDEPGFTADESEDALGERLALPPFLEGEREVIEKNLPPISFDSIALYEQ